MTKAQDPTSTYMIKSWVEQYADTLYTWVYYKTRNKELSEDLVQDTFLAALQSYTSFEGRSSPLTWLMSILKFKLIDHHRLQFKRPESEYLDGSYFIPEGGWKQTAMPLDWPESQPQEVLEKTLLHCLEKLPPSWSAVIRLKYLIGKKAVLICQELNISPTNYWQLIHRAKMQLRSCIESNLEKNI